MMDLLSQRLKAMESGKKVEGRQSKELVKGGAEEMRGEALDPLCVRVRKV